MRPGNLSGLVCFHPNIPIIWSVHSMTIPYHLRFLLFFFLLVGLPLSSQAQERAELLQQLLQPLSDTTRTTKYLQLAATYIPHEADSAAIWVDRATEAIGDGNWPPLYSETLSELSYAYMEQSVFEKANHYGLILINNYEKHEQFHLLFDMKRQLANTHSMQGETDTAKTLYVELDSLLSAQEFLDPTQGFRMRIDYYNGLGMTTAIAGDFTTSLAQFLLADSIADKHGSTMHKKECKSMLGTLYLQNDTKRAIELLKEVEKLYLEDPASYNITNVYSNLATAYVMLDSHDVAKTYLDKNIIEGRKHKDSITVGFVYLNRGNIDQDLGNYAAANQHFQTASEIFGAAGNKNLQTASKFEYVRTCLLGKIQLEESLAALPEILHYFQAENNLEKLADIYYVRAQLHYALGQYQLAFHDIEKNDSLNKVRLANNYNDEVAQMQTQYETNLYKRESAEQTILAEATKIESESKTVLLQVVGSAATLLLLILLGLVLVLNRLRQSKALIAEQKSNIEQREREKSTLLKELHHRVKNNLQIVSSLLNLQADAVKDEAAQGAFRNGQNRVEAMAMIHRYLYATDELTTLEVKSYLTQLVRSIAHSYGHDKENIDLNFDITDTPIDVDLAIPLGLIANELVSNAFKHAFKDVARPQLTVSLKLEGNLVLAVCDNGPGTDGKIIDDNSFGMELVQSLSKQLKAEMKYAFNEGACFQLTVPESTVSKTSLLAHEDRTA